MASPTHGDEFDRIVFDTGLVRIGAFRCHPSHPAFSDSGPARNYCFVFPRTAVEIQHEHERAFVANPNVVTFYNRNQAYRRSAISLSGDQCDWFGVAGDVVRDLVRTFEPSVDDRPERPFRFARAFTDPPTFLLQRRLFERVTGGFPIDALAVEEQVVLLLERVVRCAYEPRERAYGEPARQQRDAVHQAEVILSSACEENVRLLDLATEVGMSVYHLCRTFRAVTGRTLHQYQNRFRVRTSLERLCGTGRRLVDIALQFGFSSHSHFTSSFRKEFGQTPTAARHLISKATF
ncbi:MAG: AraC family transcriptional regulator [Acidobacteriia bacterium]|nr:AraC family transcriptional regulator [Terriglobia bacterium]